MALVGIVLLMLTLIMCYKTYSQQMNKINRALEMGLRGPLASEDNLYGGGGEDPEDGGIHDGFSARDGSLPSMYPNTTPSLPPASPRRVPPTAPIATPAWSGQTQTTDVTYTFGNVTDAAKTSTESIETAAVEIHDADVKTSHRELMLIPNDYSTTKLNLSYTLQLYMEVDENAANDVLVQEEGKTASAAVNIQPGYAYSFNLNVGVGKKIEFSVTSQPTWGSPQGGDITVQ